jgi:glycosyltransferase involved in cell wall biosynthesis
VILEAQASGLATLAVDEGGPRSLIEHDLSGLLVAAETAPLARALTELASDPMRRARLARGGLRAVRARTWEAALGRLADGYRRALPERASQDVHEFVAA